MVLNFKKYTLVLLLFFPLLVFSQTIKGKIVNSNGEAILSANIIIKDSVNREIPKEFTIVRNGQYSITLKNNYKKVVLEISSNGYQKDFYELEDTIKDKIYIHNFELVKDKISELKEVVIVSEKKAFVIKKDTVSYNVSAYKDGSERKIQDIIKKLPGIEVNEKSGEIKYKGRSVETVKLEGDDLFGSNYSLGTKNINVDMVEQVQAIENYSDNPLLKGIESGDKVALNLKLKKGKIDFSGNIDFGSGLFEENKLTYNDGANVLAISKNFKSFGTLSYNNVGQNNTPYDYFSYNQSVEQIKENNFYAKKIISESLFTSSLDDNRANINNQYFGNYNNIFKIGKKVSLKTNIYYLNDKIISTQNATTINYIDNENITTSDKLNIEKKPTLYKGDLELKVNTSNKSLLEYKLNIFQENITTPTLGIKNNNINFQTDLSSKNFYLKNNLLFTQKLSENKALQLSLIQSTNSTPQEFLINPSILNSTTSKDKQISNFKKNYLFAYASLLGSSKKTRYNITIGGIINSNPFNALLTNINSQTIINNSQNDITFNQKSLYLSNSISVLLGNIKITPSFKINLLSQNLLNNLGSTISQKENITFEPNLSFKYKVNEISAIISSINYNVNPLSEEHSFSNPILVNNRISQTNIPSLELQKVLNFNAFYIINNLYKQFQLNVGLNYNQNKGNFFSNVDIQNNNTFVNYFYLNENSNNLNFNFLIEKYLPNLESTIRFKSNYAISNYKNIVNNSELRNNENKLFSSEIFMKTAFDVIINFENVFQYNQNISQSNNNQNLKNSLINNTFKIIIKPSKKWFVLFSSDYFIPNTTNKNEDYLFLDTTLRYKPKNKIFDFSLVAKNILNKNTFTQIQTSDYYVSTFQNNLLSRYVMMNITYNF